MSTKPKLLHGKSWNDPKLWGELHSRHGHASHQNGNTPTYESWMAMRSRCNNIARDVDGKWGARGISIDPAWDSFEQFLADMGERPDGTTLDRYPDNNGNYGPSNCRWATPTEQARNRRNARLTFDQAVEIATRRLRGESPKALALEFGCSESLPREIVKGRTWKDALAKAQEALK